MSAIAPIAPATATQTKVERFFRMLFGEHMAESPKRGRSTHPAWSKNRPWVFLGPKENMRAVATFRSLFAKLYDEDVDTTYYTPNSFYRSDRRQVSALRWIHAIALDIDTKGRHEHNQGITTADVLDRCRAAGLPTPTAIIQTPSGGFQPIWILSKAVRATPKVVPLYEAIQRHMAADVGADMFAIGAERIFRTPTEDNLVYFSENTYDFQIFVDWREINHPRSEEQHKGFLVAQRVDIMSHPAVLRLYSQEAVIGTREKTCFTLALCMKFSGWPEEKAVREMTRWWEECCEKGGRDPFTLQDALYRVHRIYRRAHLQIPSPDTIRQLTGLDFSFEKIRFFRRRKSRHERKYVHREERIQDLIKYLKSCGGRFVGSTASLAQAIGAPVSSLKVALAGLQADRKVVIQSKKGRKGSISICLVQENSQIDNTIGEVVGGRPAVLISLAESSQRKGYWRHMWWWRTRRYVEGIYQGQEGYFCLEWNVYLDCFRPVRFVSKTGEVVRPVQIALESLAPEEQWLDCPPFLPSATRGPAPLEPPPSPGGAPRTTSCPGPKP